MAKVSEEDWKSCYRSLLPGIQRFCFSMAEREGLKEDDSGRIREALNLDKKMAEHIKKVNEKLEK